MQGFVVLEIMRKVLIDVHTHTVASVHAYSSLQEMAKAATILGSDAHISFQIADYERLYPLLAETDFPDELIMRSTLVAWLVQEILA